MIEIPRTTLNNGVAMPKLGLGTYKTNDGQEVIDAIHTALDEGYRLIDTAAMYANEEGVGEAIRTSNVPREELFITTKLWNSDQGHENAMKAFDDSLKRLGLDYVNLYLIHWPVPRLDKYVETWQALEEIYKSGRAKAIGVCNFSVEHLEKLLAAATVTPSINQVEMHPRLAQRKTREFCADKGIQLEAWRPLGASDGSLLRDATITNIADKHKRTPAQILLRWNLQEGSIAIPKSTHAKRIRENADVFEFELDNDDMAKISALDTGERDGPDPDTMNHY